MEFVEVNWEDSTLLDAANGRKIRILRAVLDLEVDMVAMRRHFHAHPELSFEEHETARYIVQKLESIGITEIKQGVGKTGVVAMIRGEAGPGPTIGLRADMDALPVQESADVAYRSVNVGVMHACGHDGHMAELLGAAQVLFNRRNTMRGSVKLIFQPAEEGRGGARAMIADGVLNDIDFIYGIHLWSFDPLGSVACREGPIMAASDKFCIEVKGKGGHGAAPQGTVDAIVSAATLVTSLQTIVSRNKDPLQSGVVTVGTINGGFGYNVIADQVLLTGTCRSFTTETQELIKTRMECLCCGMASAFGGEINLDYQYGYPPTINSSPECVGVVTTAAAKIVGLAHSACTQKTMGTVFLVSSAPPPHLPPFLTYSLPLDPPYPPGAEDFSYFLQEKPGAFFFVGASLPGETRPHHKSVFDYDERAHLIGASILVQIVQDVLC